MLGGGQERDRRSGTHNVAGIVAMAAAARRHRRRARRRRSTGSARCATGWPTGCSPRCPARSRDRGDRARTRSPASATSASTASRARRCCSCSTRRGVCASAALVVRERRAWSRRTCWRRWACRGRSPVGRCGCRSAGRRPTPTSTARSRSFPAAVRAAAACIGSMTSVLVAMSGGVDSSVAAALLVDAGPRRRRRHDEAVGRRQSDTGCCSVADVDDARRVAQQLGIDHHVFNFGDDFDAPRRRPVRRRPRRRAHAEPVHRVQPPPQVRPAAAAGRRARLRRRRHRPPRPHRGRRDGGSRRRPRRRPGQGPVLRAPHARPGAARARAASRSATSPRPRCARQAAALGLRTAAKPDSQDVCFITATGGRAAFLDRSHRLHPGPASSTPPAAEVGAVDAVELVTVGQRQGLGLARRRRRRGTSSTSTCAARHGHGRRGTPTCSTDNACVTRRVAVGDGRTRRRARAVQRPRRRAPGRFDASTATRDAGRRARSAGSRPARASCSTTATRCSAAASRSAEPALPRFAEQRPGRPSVNNIGRRPRCGSDAGARPCRS